MSQIHDDVVWACASCSWWQRLPRDVHNPYKCGECRVSPPTASQNRDEPGPCWPLSREDDWCGAFKYDDS
jgi:hypothetical protein